MQVKIIQRLFRFPFAGKGWVVQCSPPVVIHLFAVPSLQLGSAAFPAEFCVHGWLHHFSSVEEWLTCFTVMYAYRVSSLIWWQITLNRKIYSDVIPRINPSQYLWSLKFQVTGFQIHPVVHSLADRAVYFLKALCAAQQEMHASGTAVTMLMMIIVVMVCVCTAVIYCCYKGKQVWSTMFMKNSAGIPLTISFLVKIAEQT